MNATNQNAGNGGNGGKKMPLALVIMGVIAVIIIAAMAYGYVADNKNLLPNYPNSQPVFEKTQQAIDKAQEKLNSDKAAAVSEACAAAIAAGARSCDVDLSDKPAKSVLPKKEERVLTPTPGLTEIPVDKETPEPEVKSAIRLASGRFLNWEAESDKYRQKDGYYLIPVNDIKSLDSGAKAILFEGEFFDSVGTHTICFLTGDFKNLCKTEDGKIHINMGSFWAYKQNSRGDLADDLLAVFAHDKWQNWNEQKIEGNPIDIQFSFGVTSYGAGEEPELNIEQQKAANRNAAERCTGNTPVLLENPYSDFPDENEKVAVGAPGSFACKTLFVGKIDTTGALIATYWNGAKDNFSYIPSESSIYIIPSPWGEIEIKAYAEKFGAKFLGEYKTK